MSGDGWEPAQTRARWRRELFPALTALRSGHWIGPRMDVSEGVPKFDVSNLWHAAEHTDFGTIRALAVPFAEWWMEGGRRQGRRAVDHYAGHFTAAERRPGEPLGAWLARLPERAKREMRDRPRFRFCLPRARWVVVEHRATLWRESGGSRRAASPGMALVAALDEDGELLMLGGGTEDDAHVPELRPLMEMLGEAERVGEESMRRAESELAENERALYASRGRGEGTSLTTPGWLALALLRCRNVTEWEVGRNRRRRAAAAEELGAGDEVRYRLLEIDPMRKRSAGEADAEGEGQDGPLTIVRGHFKDYRERGLFGKIRGIFYWEPHVRGSPERGVTEKDYRVRAESGGGGR